MFGIGTPELLIIMFVVLLLFGSKKLPELARGLGKGMREFKKATSEIQEELDLNAPIKNETPPKIEESKEGGEQPGNTDKSK